MSDLIQTSSTEPLPTESVSRPLSLSFLLYLLKQGRRRIGIAAVVGLALAAIFAWTQPNTYTASSSFIPAGSNNTSSAAALMGQLSGFAGAGLLGGRSQGDLYIGILKSHTIGREMVNHFNLQSAYKVKRDSDAERMLASRSSFEAGLKDPVVTVSVVDTDPTRARDLANGYLDALQNTSTGLALSESSQRRLFYEQRLAKERDELGSAEIALKQSQEKSGLIAPAGQTASEIQTLASLNAQVTDRQVRLAALLHDETEQNPDVLRLRREIANLQGQTSQMESGQSSGQYGRFSTAQVPQLQLDFIRKTRDVKYHEALFDIIAKQYEAAKLDEAKDAPLQVLDRATVPDLKTGPHRTFLMALGLLVGCFTGIAWVLWRSADSRDA